MQQQTRREELEDAVGHFDDAPRIKTELLEGISRYPNREGRGCNGTGSKKDAFGPLLVNDDPK